MIVKVIFPNGGERLKIGETYTVKWESSGIEFVNIYLREENIKEECYLNEEPIMASLGSYTFKLDKFICRGMTGKFSPQPIEPSESDWYIINISVPYESGMRIEDWSDDYFSIVKNETADWQTYTRDKDYGGCKYEIKYPEKGIDSSDISAHNYVDRYKYGQDPHGFNVDVVSVSGLSAVNPRVVDTKFFKIITWSYPNPLGCSLEYILGQKVDETETKELDGNLFIKEIKNIEEEKEIFKHVSYSLKKDNCCIILMYSFVLYDSGLFTKQPPPFDQEKEIEVFNQMLSTFKFLD